MDENTSLSRALDDGLAVVGEWDGGTIEERLRAVGLDPDEVREVAQERYEAYVADPVWAVRVDLETFAAGLAEGLIAGVIFERQRGA